MFVSALEPLVDIRGTARIDGSPAYLQEPFRDISLQPSLYFIVFFNSFCDCFLQSDFSQLTRKLIIITELTDQLSRRLLRLQRSRPLLDSRRSEGFRARDDKNKGKKTRLRCRRVYGRMHI